MHRRRAPASRFGRRLAHETPLAVDDELGRTAAVRAGDDRLARRERLDGHEPIVFADRGKAHDPAAREMLEQFRFRQCARELHAAGDPEMRRERVETPALLAVAGDHRAETGAISRRQCADEQVRSFQRRQARDHEHVVVESVAAIRALGRRRIQHGAAQLRPHRQTFLNRPGLHEQPPDVAGQQVAVGGVRQPAPYALLRQPETAETARQSRPQVVVLTHRVVQPAHVIRMANGVTGVAQADHAIDRLAVAHPDIGQPGRQVCGGLAAEAVLRCDDDVRVMTLGTKCVDQRAGDHHVPAFGHRRAGRDDGYAHRRRSRGPRRTAASGPGIRDPGSGTLEPNRAPCQLRRGTTRRGACISRTGVDGAASRTAGPSGSRVPSPELRRSVSLIPPAPA